MSESTFNAFFTAELKTADKSTAEAPWLGGRNGEHFRCCFCGLKLKEGDKYRVIYTNDMPKSGGNPLTCEACNDSTPQMRAKWLEKCRIAYSDEWWWFTGRA